MSGGGQSAAWEHAAAEWTRWARSRELDHPFWEYNLPAFLGMLPAPGRLTVDVGCGEGRLARELLGLGHRVVGVDSSPSLAAAARSEQPSFELHVGDAAAMPLGDASADLAVSMMALMTMDDVPAVLRETARVLEPGGRLCIAVLHPVETWADAGVGYFTESRYAKRVVRDAGEMTFHDVHRPLSHYFDALTGAGFLVELVEEPPAGEEYVRRHPECAHWRERPFLLHLRAVRMPGGPARDVR